MKPKPKLRTIPKLRAKQDSKLKHDTHLYDCIIVGAGPAGLTAANYLSRFRCAIKVIDNKQSRASLIPVSHNIPGFPQGISGKNLLTNMRRHYLKYGRAYQNKILNDTCTAIKKDKRCGNFTVTTLQSILHAKNIILATGVVDIEPILPDLKNTIKKGLIRHCPVCDGYEVIDKKIAIVAVDFQKGLEEALFLSVYSQHIYLFYLDGNFKLTKADKHKIKKANIKLINCGIEKIKVVKNKITSFITADSNIYEFDTVYSALGSCVRSQLAIDLGVKHDKDKRLIVNAHQETNVRGFYAIGDVVEGLNQVCVATGQAAIAAVCIYNDLRE